MEKKENKGIQMKTGLAFHFHSYQSTIRSSLFQNQSMRQLKTSKLHSYLLISLAETLMKSQYQK